MSVPVDREGTFRATPIEWHTNRSRSGALALVVNYRLDQYLDPETKTWVAWSEYDMEIIGRHYLTKKDGSLSELTIEDVIGSLGWSGVFADLKLKATKLTKCQITICNETYQNETSLKIKWLNKWDSVPGGGSASDDDLKALDKQFGAQLRAMRGNAAMNEIDPPATDAEGAPF